MIVSDSSYMLTMLCSEGQMSSVLQADEGNESEEIQGHCLSLPVQKDQFTLLKEWCFLDLGVHIWKKMLWRKYSVFKNLNI